MPRKLFIALLLLLCSLLLPAQEVLRGEVRVELMPIFGTYVDAEYPLQHETAYRRALQKASVLFAAQIYGWSFHYDIGERARGIDEVFELTPLGEIPWGDPNLYVTQATFQNRDRRFTSHGMADELSIWVDYRPSITQSRRLEMWRMGNIRSAQAIGYAQLSGPDDDANWLSVQMAALEDSARAAVRAMLQGSERNRPKEARGFISLQNFPTFWLSGGRWTVSARFRVEITEIIPFAAH